MTIAILSANHFTYSYGHVIFECLHISREELYVQGHVHVRVDDDVQYGMLRDNLAIGRWTCD